LTERMAPCTIHRMNPGDLEHVLALEKDAFADPWQHSDFVDELHNPRSRIQLAKGDDGQLLGYVVYWVVADEVQILDVAVAIPHRRKGVARRLLAYVLDECKAGQTRLFTLEVRQSNIAAIGLYQSLGFQCVATRKGYYSDNKEDALIMNLTFTGAAHAI